ncbi:MAG: DUF6111 family protein [Roseibium album]|uniref:Uncharacterized protein n=1 Tax=Roseibium album TaxID=311410 RepID=A0A0M7AR37_9HYPH|nr:DUF6111 family protein [Roseibium album]MBG6146585.1 hypothetical protein [Labrenzia sp. EL_142]MBG6156417.1 hypothetical protein [Labrenzia sp. EL_162]MBG6164752.1 hypothetical protein [Labrenzia sp. EL_195]MBG6173560.1 hypothetical protein [Labrenzia sp. EL_132]MBG6195643.1 hypothetical protein [Labrenzia sp. EL_159]MBG6202174.1 hypothetical protein [Labrenzia sp. EL_13]MBG6208492.1 hypothetical protein [Labrenzia sp. EL_126]MBG6227670.1 hypothetical protein [Labrenzia sp. EL_208]MCR9
MLRVALTHLILFLLPFFCYALWLWLTKRSQHPDRWAKGPLAWLTVTGLVFVIVGFLVMSTFNRGPEGTDYRPTQMKDGVFVPGGFE